MCLGEIGVVAEVWTHGDLPMARLEGRADAVCTLYRPEVAPGDHVLAHLGYVTDVLTAQQAAEATSLRSAARDPKEEPT